MNNLNIAQRISRTGVALAINAIVIGFPIANMAVALVAVALSIYLGITGLIGTGLFSGLFGARTATRRQATPLRPAHQV